MAAVSFEIRRSIDTVAHKVEQEEKDFTYDGVLEKFRSIKAPISRYLFLRELHRLDTSVYYNLLQKHTEEILPYIYTPTVGEACERYHKLGLRTHGLMLSLHDKGHILAKLQAWPKQDIRVIVVTDGERILGLGDLGTGGMGISEGKITLYTAAAGVDPSQCLPVCLDVGTNNKALLDDPDYPGIRQPRITGAEYDAFLQEFMDALAAWQPHLLLQFEDFGNANAFRLLETHRSRLCCFNDDIQGTASICLSALLSACRLTGKPLSEHRVLFLGAGEAGTGIGQLLATYLHLRKGVTLEEGRRQCLFMDSKGLICSTRTGLAHHKAPFAHDVPYQPDLLSAVHALRPTALVGVSTIAGAFNEDVVRAMARYNDRPIIMPLSNPTSKAECTYENAFRWTDGKVLFASGSPFEPVVTPEGVAHYPAQANNAYIFPAVGFAALLTQCRTIADSVFVVAAEELAEMTSIEEVEHGRLFPPFSRIRAVSKVLTARVAQHMVLEGLGSVPPGCRNWEPFVESKQWTIRPAQLGPHL